MLSIDPKMLEASLRNAEPEPKNEPLNRAFAKQKLGEGAFYLFVRVLLPLSKGEIVNTKTLDLNAFTYSEIEELYDYNNTYFDAYGPVYESLNRIFDNLKRCRAEPAFSAFI